jgi:DNA-binding protein H-NS
MATLEQIQAKMDKLKAQAEALATKNAQVVVDKIRGLMLKHGLTTKDIEAEAKTKRAAKTATVSSAVNASKTSVGEVAAKYQDPKSGATWTGRGRAPAWIARAKDRSKFLIGADAGAVVASNQAAVGKAKSKANTAVAKKASANAVVVRKAQPEGEQAAKYRDPKSGATWSGRGRAPLWIAGAKDRNKFLIDGAQNAAPVAKTNKPKAVVTKAVTTKAAAPVAKTNKPKAAVTKAVTTKAAAPVAKTAKPKAAVTKAVTTKAAAPVTKTAKPKAAVKKDVTTQAAAPVAKADEPKAAVTKAPVAKKTDAVKKAVVAKSPAASEKIAEKKPVAAPAKPKAVKKAAPAETAAVDTVAATSDVPAAPAAPVAPVELAV